MSNNYFTRVKRRSVGVPRISKGVMLWGKPPTHEPRDKRRVIVHNKVQLRPGAEEVQALPLRLGRHQALPFRQCLDLRRRRIRISRR